MRELIAIYDEVVKALDARKLARDAASRVPRPGDGGKIFVLGLGKVASELFEGVRDALGPVHGTLVAPKDAPRPPGALVIHGDHPVPDRESLRAGESLLAAARSLRPEDTALVLLSGGGSALAEAPRPGLALDDVREINLALLRSGLPIEQMNCVRSHLSRLKGGGLARALHAAGVKRARALVAVDVPLGGVAAVSSGPAIADPTTCADALRLVRDHRLPTAATRVHETLKAGDPADFISHEALCDLRSPATIASGNGKRAAMLESPVRGSVEAFAQKIEKLHGFHAASGELELKIPPSAPAGGRDQHLALLVALKIRGAQGAGFLAAGTDGRDGPTDAAGAWVDGTSWDEAERRGLEPARALKEFDASRVLRELGCLLPSRHSSAHAGDLYLFKRP